MATDFYKILGLARDATPDQVHARFLELARSQHPDRFGGARKEEAEKRFQEITEAFNVLSNPERRRAHDQELARPDPRQGRATDPQQLVRVYLQRGVAAYKAGNYFEAADNFNRATQADPENAKAWNNLARACARNPRWSQRALDAIARACELEPMNTGYLKLAGQLFQRAGMAEEAERYYNQALKWGEDDPAVLQALEELRKARASGKGLPRFFRKAE